MKSEKEQKLTVNVCLIRTTIGIIEKLAGEHPKLHIKAHIDTLKSFLPETLIKLKEEAGHED